MRSHVLVAAVLLLASGCSSPPQESSPGRSSSLWPTCERLCQHRFVDLTHVFDEDIPHFAAFPQMTMPGDQLDEMIDIINDNGAGVIGTPERARAQVQRLWDQSGGFGCILQMGHEWANPAATKRSAELFAAEVMPHFQGLAQPTLDAAARAGQVRDDLAQTQLQAIEHMTKKYESEKRPTNTV